MIWWEQSSAFGDNAMAIVVGITGEGNIVFVF